MLAVLVIGQAAWLTVEVRGKRRALQQARKGLDSLRRAEADAQEFVERHKLPYRLEFFLISQYLFEGKSQNWEARKDHVTRVIPERVATRMDPEPDPTYIDELRKFADALLEAKNPQVAKAHLTDARNNLGSVAVSAIEHLLAQSDDLLYKSGRTGARQIVELLYRCDQLEAAVTGGPARRASRSFEPPA